MSRRLSPPPPFSALKRHGIWTEFSIGCQYFWRQCSNCMCMGLMHQTLLWKWRWQYCSSHWRMMSSYDREFDAPCGGGHAWYVISASWRHCPHSQTHSGAIKATLVNEYFLQNSEVHWLRWHPTIFLGVAWRSRCTSATFRQSRGSSQKHWQLLWPCLGLFVLEIAQ